MKWFERPDLNFALGVEDTFVPQWRVGERPLDEYELTQHYRFWHSDLALATDAGATMLRWGIPWYRINPGRDVWKWDWLDRVVDRFQELQLEPIVDLMHYGTPTWLDNEFINASYPAAVAEYAAQVAQRYRGALNIFTPLNEPMLNVLHCGEFGYWPPNLHGDDGFVQVLRGVSRGIVETQRALTEASGGQATFVHVEASFRFTGDVDAYPEQVAHLRERAYLVEDLLTGAVGANHVLVPFLRRHGFTDGDLAWATENTAVPDVMGVNYYPTVSTERFTAGEFHTGGPLDIRPRVNAWTEGLEEVLTAYANRYARPVFLTETSILGTPAERIAWLDASVAHVEKLRTDGLDVVGYTWWPLFDMMEWTYREGALPPEGYLMAGGLWDLVPDEIGELARVRNPLADRFRELALKWGNPADLMAQIECPPQPATTEPARSRGPEREVRRCPVAAIAPAVEAALELTPLGSDSVQIVDGFWGRRLATNRAASLPHAFSELIRAGNIAYLEAAARRAQAPPTVPALLDRHVYKILDSDVYKWLEAVAWERPTRADDPLYAAAESLIETIWRVATADGYVGSWVQLHPDARRWQFWRDGHELYNAGHLIQAAVAWHRSLGDPRLLQVATAMADLMVEDLGDAAILPAHPGVESALVELYRTTGTHTYLDLAERFVRLRGHGLLPATLLGKDYFVDDRPLSESTEARGHAVMALYLLHGVVDLAAETRRPDYLAIAEAQWTDMTARKMYLTGGLGARHHGEAFGAAYELPADRAYAETCAAVASVMLSWRLLLATGATKYADLIERTLYNAVLAGVSLDGRGFFYTNTLHSRTAATAADGGTHGRRPWFECACCPPNLMRLLSSLEQYVATVSPAGLQLHQLLSCDIATSLDIGPVRLQVRTELPAGDGTVTITVEHCGVDSQWTLSIRVPTWSATWSFEAHTATGEAIPAREEAAARSEADGYLRVTRSWATGDVVTLHLDLTPRWIAPDPRIDAVRGCVALARGPVVYCVEDADLPAGIELDDLVVPLAPATAPGRTDTSGPLADALTIVGYKRVNASTVAQPAAALAPVHPPVGGPPTEPGTDALEVTALPYHSWANRGSGAMRVWLPHN